MNGMWLLIDATVVAGAGLVIPASGARWPWAWRRVALACAAGLSIDADAVPATLVGT